MADISTANLDNDQDSPRAARVEILETVQRVNALTRTIQTPSEELVVIDSDLNISGDTAVAGKLAVNGELSFTDAGNAGQVMTSQGDGQPVTWTDVVSGDKYKVTSTTSLTLDETSPKLINVGLNLAYTAGQGIVVYNTNLNYFNGTVRSYNPANGNLVFVNERHVGSGTYSEWQVNISGVPGGKGDEGDDGEPGSIWYNGNGVPDNELGKDTDYYINKLNGDYYEKQTASWVLLGNLTGPAGSGGGGSSMVFNTQCRYQAVTTSGLGVTIVSAATVKTGIAWARTGTSMTFTDNNHGRSVGERAILKNVNVTGFDSLITAVTQNTFTVNCADSGAASGTAGAYSMGFTFAYNAAAGSITAGTISAPANWDCVLLSIRLHLAANTRGATSFNLTVPKGNVNGVGPHTSIDDVSIPVQQIRQDVTNLTAVGNTIAYNVGGDWGVYTFGALPAATTGIQILANF